MSNTNKNKIFGYIYIIYHPNLYIKNDQGEFIPQSYIGRTEKSVSMREKQHQRDCKKFKDSEKGGDGKLHAVMWSYGPKCLICDELDKAYSPEELSQKEAFYQEKYQSIKYGWNKIAASTHIRISPTLLKIIINGTKQSFTSKAQMCRKLGINESTVTYQVIIKKLSLEDAVHYAIDAKIKRNEKNNNPITIYRVSYATFNEAVRDRKLNKHKLHEKSLRSRINKQGMTLEEAFSTPPKRGRNKEITITTPDGITHTFSTLADAHNILRQNYKVAAYSTVVEYFRRFGQTIEQAFGFTIRPWEVNYIEADRLIESGYTLVGEKSGLGNPVQVVLHLTKEVFASIKDFSLAFNYDYTTIAEWLKRGLTAEEILAKYNHPLITKRN